MPKLPFFPTTAAQPALYLACLSSAGGAEAAQQELESRGLANVAKCFLELLPVISQGGTSLKNTIHRLLQGFQSLELFFSLSPIPGGFFEAFPQSL